MTIIGQIYDSRDVCNIIIQDSSTTTFTSARSMISSSSPFLTHLLITGPVAAAAAVRITDDFVGLLED